MQKNKLSESRVGQLNDTCFSEATEALSNICREFKEELGTAPSLPELLEILTWAIKAIPDDLVDGLENSEVSELKATIRKSRKQKLTLGDVCAFPDGAGGYRLGVFLGKNHLSSAVILLKGHFSLTPLRRNGAVKYIPYPRYVFLADRIVPVVGRLERIAQQFADAPWTIRSPHDFPENPSIGKYGSVIADDNSVTYLTKDEARKLGITDGSFIQFMEIEDVAKFVDHYTEMDDE